VMISRLYYIEHNLALTRQCNPWPLRFGPYGHEWNYNNSN
jgi:hypothetical protein